MKTFAILVLATVLLINLGGCNGVSNEERGKHLMDREPVISALDDDDEVTVVEESKPIGDSKSLGQVTVRRKKDGWQTVAIVALSRSLPKGTKVKLVAFSYQLNPNVWVRTVVVAD